MKTVARNIICAIIVLLALPASADLTFTITLVRNGDGTIRSSNPDGDFTAAGPSAPVLGQPIASSDTAIINILQTASTGGSAPLTYTLERSATSALTGFADIDADTTFIDSENTDTSLTPETPYWYRLRAVDNATIESVPSNIVTTTTLATPEPVPDPPGDVNNLSAATITTNSIEDWTWDAATDATSYNIVLGFGDGAGNPVSGQTVDNTTLTTYPGRFGLTPEQEHYIRACAVNVSGLRCSPRVFYTTEAEGGSPPPPSSGIIFGPYTHENEAVGQSQTVSGVWGTSTKPSSPSGGTTWQIKAGSDSPIITGSKYWHTRLCKNGTTHYRTERSGNQNETLALPMTSAGGDNYVATQKLKYAFLFRIDEMDHWGPGDRGGHLFQFHHRNFNLPAGVSGRSPNLSLKTDENGIFVYLEKNGDNGGVTFHSPHIFGNNIVGEIHAVTIEVLWDSRTAAEGSTGILRVYVDANTSPSFSWLNKQNVQPLPWLDDQTPRRMPYVKWGGYRKAFDWSTAIPDGSCQQIDWDNFVVLDGDATQAEVLNALDWANRVQ